MQILQQAVRWHEATARGDCDWDAFTAWLEEQPAHRDAYDDVATLDDAVGRARPQLAAAYSILPAGRRPAWPRARLWLGAAAAAAVVTLALLVAWPRLPVGAAPPIATYQAGATATRRLVLDDGSVIVLAPGSSVNVSGRRQDHIELQGAAYFDVPHDPGRALVVWAGGYAIRDIGTRFEVVGGQHQLKVAVTAGTVAVELPQHAGAAQVTAGQRLLVTGEPPVAEYASIAAEDVASWRDGRLVFRNEPLSMVVQQVGRHAGVAVVADPEIADRRFSGVLTIGDGSQLVARLEQIMALDGTRLGDGSIRLSAAGRQR